MKTDLFQSCDYCWVFQICWEIECSTLTSSSFRILNSSAGIPSPPLALFVGCFLRPIWLHIPGCLALGEWSHHRGYLGHYLFLYRSLYSCHLFLLSPAFVKRSWMMVEYKDMCSSSVRTPKLQFAAEQPLNWRMLDPTKKRYPMSMGKVEALARQ